MSGLYLREWRSAVARSQNSTPDLFATNPFKVFGIRRALTKLGATAIIDLETLSEHELEQMRLEIAAQLSARIRGASAEQQQEKQ